jgi:hypothetical protein
MLKPMDPALLYQLVNSEPDVLTKAAEEDEAIYKKARCPICSRDGCTKKIEAPLIVEAEGGMTMIRTPFGDGPLPHGYAHCGNCGTDFDPHTGIVRKTEASIIAGPQSDPLPG